MDKTLRDRISALVAGARHTSLRPWKSGAFRTTTGSSCRFKTPDAQRGAADASIRGQDEG